MTAPLSRSALKDSRLVGETSGRIRQLSGFQKGFREPQEITSVTQNFVRRIGATEVADRAEEIFQALRRQFAYKRKELRLALADGAATIGTPDFDVNLWIEQDADRPDAYRLLTQVASFRTPAVVHDDRFQLVFGKYCDRVVIEFTKSFRIEAKIDEIESLPALAPYLDYDAKGLWFTLRLPSSAVQIHVTENRLTLALAAPGNLKLLLDQALSALAALCGSSAMQALP
jgi:hypothetical protein